MNDLIRLKDLRVRGKHGVGDLERADAQEFVVNLEIAADLSEAAQTDGIGDTIDYSVLRTKIVQIVETHSYHLLERLAGEILAAIFKDVRIERARVSIAKPHRLVDCAAEVSLERDNPEPRAQPEQVQRGP
jgi:dihydroneopterin aldolase